MYKIYVNNKPVYLTASLPTANPTQQSKSCIQVSYKNRSELKELINHINWTRQLEVAYITGKNEEDLFKDFAAFYKLIDAAGGLVFNEFDEALLIYRHGKWDLPKGKLEKGETVEDAAVREVEEETGIQGIELGKPIILQREQNITFHTFLHPVKKQLILKRIFWYKMFCKKQAVQPQVEEGIQKVEWVPRAEVKARVANGFGSIMDVVEEGMK